MPTDATASTAPDVERPLAAVILAAGQGTRMNSTLVKVLHPVAGRQMIRHVIAAVRGVGASRIVCVIGYQAERVRDALKHDPEFTFAVQEEPRGTGDALKSAATALEGFPGDVLVVCGDTPLLTSVTLRRVIERHRATDASATVLAARLEDPTGYGRVVIDEDGRVERIVEEKDTSPVERAIELVNTGVYCLDWPVVRPLLECLSTDNAQGEVYLTDVPVLLADRDRPARACRLDDPVEMSGVNDRRQLADAEAVLRERIRTRLMEGGVTFLAPDTALVDADVEIGPDTIVYPGVLIEGASSIGAESVIGPFSRIVDSHIGRGVELRGYNYLARTTIAPGSIVKAYVAQGAD